MTFVEGRVRVTVPATSANLGPGFDSLGLALALRDEVARRGARRRASPSPSGARAPTRCRATRATSSSGRCWRRSTSWGRGRPGSRSRVATSSRTAAVSARRRRRSWPGSRWPARWSPGGTLLVDDDRLFSLAARDRGASRQRRAGLLRRARDQRPARATASSPSRPTSTRGSASWCSCRRPRWQTTVARALLPDTVPHADAAANAGRAALLVAALAGRPEHLLLATRDLLHQDYRAPAMPDSAALVAALRADGVPALVSGAGPTVLAFCDGPDLTPGSAESLLDRCPAGWTALAPRGRATGRRAGLSRLAAGECATDATSAGSWC